MGQRGRSQETLPELRHIRSAHVGERSESRLGTECCSWASPRIRPDHARLREINTERLVLDLFEQREAVSVRIQRIVQQRFDQARRLVAESLGDSAENPTTSAAERSCPPLPGQQRRRFSVVVAAFFVDDFDE
jgi:hypothetical protein